MPVNDNTYNTRLTDESLEKRFRDTFRAQGGAELVDDLYASGVIVPVVDFTAAAEGSALRSDLQTAWDFSTGFATRQSSTPFNIITNAGFWQIDLTHTGFDESAAASGFASVELFDGTTAKQIWSRSVNNTGNNDTSSVLENKFIVFVRANDVVRVKCMFNGLDIMDVWYRQVADVYGNLTQPSGYISS